MRNTHEQTAATSRGFTQIFGLDPRIAFLTFVIDLMLFGGEVLTLGLLIPIALVVGIVLGFIAYRAQMRWYGDDRESALIKGVIIGLLTAIPTPLPAILYIPSGLLGLIHMARRGWGRLTFRDQNYNHGEKTIDVPFREQASIDQFRRDKRIDSAQGH
jgi:hypothetical protein